MYRLPDCKQSVDIASQQSATQPNSSEFYSYKLTSGAARRSDQRPTRGCKSYDRHSQSTHGRCHECSPGCCSYGHGRVTIAWRRPCSLSRYSRADTCWNGDCKQLSAGCALHKSASSGFVLCAIGCHQLLDNIILTLTIRVWRTNGGVILGKLQKSVSRFYKWSKSKCEPQY